MRIFFVVVAYAGMQLMAQAQESSSSPLHAAEGGGADVAWPRKPDNRLSSLSGKMMDFRQIPNKGYGGSKEFRSERVYEDRQVSSLATVPMWSTTESDFGKKNTSRFNKSSGMDEKDLSHRFDPLSAQEEIQVREERQLSRREATGWSSRTSRTAQASDGSAILYEGRLTRLRQQVNREATSTDRDLGKGHSEKYSPEEVNRILKQQPGLPEIKETVRPALPVRAESPVASRPLAAGS